MSIKNCAECPLFKHHGKKVLAFRGKDRVGSALYCEVPYRGPKTSANIMVVGESPGTVEIFKRTPFVGESGELVERVFLENGIRPAAVFFANACRCMLGKEDKADKKALKKALECCRPALARTIRILCPKLIVCFGDVALHQVLKQSGITKKRGKLQRSEEFDCWVLPTFHPMACLRDPAKFAFWRPDMAAVARFQADGFTPPKAEAVSYSDVDSIRFLLDKKDITLALDTETQGKDWSDPNSVVISYSVSDESGKGYNIWLCRECQQAEADRTILWPRKNGKKSEPAQVFVRREPEYDRRISELLELCRRKDIKKVMMNGNFDLHRLRQLGIQREDVVSYTMDIQLTAHALDPDNFIKASMADIQTAFLSGRADHKAMFADSGDKTDMLKSALENPEKHTLYAAADADATLSCAAVLKSRLLKDKKLANYYVQLAHPVQSQILYEIEKNGILFNLEKLPETKERVAEIMLAKEREFLELVPSKILDKHRQLGLKLTRAAFIRDVFFSGGGFRLPVLQKTPGGDPTTDRKILVRLRDDLEESRAKDALSLLIEWGPYQKLYSTYLKGFEEAVKPDGRLHTQITKCGTATGRTSSSNPNLQNIPKRNKEIQKAIRALLHAPEGKILVAVDYSQSELRWIAHESGDSGMVGIFARGEDMHTVTGRGLAEKKGLIWDSLDAEAKKKYRQDAKPVNFGLPYGQSSKGFQAYARDNYGVVFPLTEAEEYRHAFLHTIYPALPAWHERRKDEARKTGFVRSEYGFIRRTPNILNSDMFLAGEDERVAINTGIQSASNDSTLLGALEARRSGVVDDKRARLVLFIHDELIYEVDEDYVEDFVPMLIRHLENLPTERFGFRMRVPLVAEAKTGIILSDMKDFTLPEAGNG